MNVLIKVLVFLIHVFTLGRLKYSLPTEGNALTMKLPDKLWWGYKFFGHPVLEPEKGKGIREHFKKNPISGFSVAGDSNIRDSHQVRQLTITLAGDLLSVPRAEPGGTAHFLDDVSDFLFNADFRCANLESPVVKDRPLSYPSDNITAPPDLNNTPEAVSLFIRDGKGINVFSAAMNHSLDQGAEGVKATLDFLDEKKVYQVGMARNQKERDSFPVLEANGIKVAFLSWTFSLNDKTLPEGQEYLTNVLRLNLPDVDLSPIVSQVKQAREKKADVVVLCLHWGLEYERFPLAHQIEKAHFLIEAGVDIIAGNHPHSLQPAERYTYRDSSSTQRDGLIFYALGDLVSPFPEVGYCGLGALARVKLVRLPNSKVLIQSAEIKPIHTYQNINEEGKLADIRVMDFMKLKRRLQNGDLAGGTSSAGDPVLKPRHVKLLRKLISAQEDLLPEAGRAG